MKFKPKNKASKHKQTEDLSHISASLLPSTALAAAVPQSPRQINLSRSPSPLARAIASFTQVGQSIAGDTLTKRSKSEENLHQTPQSRGRTLAKRSMIDRPPMPLPNSHPPNEATNYPLYETTENQSFFENEHNNKNIEDIYAKVNKPNKQLGRPRPLVDNDNNTIPPSDDDITIVSNNSELFRQGSLRKITYNAPTNSKNTVPRKKQAQPESKNTTPKKKKKKKKAKPNVQVQSSEISDSKHNTESLLKSSSDSKVNEKDKYNVNLTQQKSKIKNQNNVILSNYDGDHVDGYVTVDEMLSKEKHKKLSERDSHRSSPEQNMNSLVNKVVPHAVDNDDSISHSDFSLQDNAISEGQVFHVDKKSLGSMSDIQRMYLSTESLDQEYLILAGNEMRSIRNVTSPQLHGSLNSSLSASNFISPEKVMERYGRKIHSSLDVIPSERIENEDEDEQQLINETDETLVDSKRSRETGDMAGTASTSPVSKTLNKSVRQSQPQTKSSRRNRSNDSLLPENYLHMSPRRSSTSSLRHTSTPPRVRHASDASSLISTEGQHDISGNELKIRRSYNNHLMETMTTLKELSSSVQSPARKKQTQYNIVMLHQLASENRQIIDNPTTTSNPVENGSSVSLCSLHYQQTQNKNMDKKVKSLETDRKVLQDLNQCLVNENNNLRQMANGRDFNVENEHLNRQLKMLSDENKSMKEKLILTKRDRNMEYPEYLNSFGIGNTSGKLDDTHLVRLLHTYDEKLKEKAQIIKTYESRLSELELRMQQPVIHHHDKRKGLRRMNPFAKHNKEQNRISKESEQADLSVSIEEWIQLKEQSKLVLEENELLVEQKMLYKKTIDDLTIEYQQEATKLSKETMKHVQEKKSLEHLLSESHLENTQLKNKVEKLMKIIEDESVDKDDYSFEIAKVKREHKMDLNSIRNERDNYKAKLEATTKEKDVLAIQVTDLTATVSRLKQELELTEKNYWKCEKRLTHCLKHLDTLFGKEMNVKETLSNVVKIAEKNAKDKNHLEKLIASEKEKNQTALDQLQIDDFKITHLQDKLKRQKEKSRKKVAGVHDKIEHHNKEMSSLMKSYEKEIDDLKDIVVEKQRFIDRFQSSKRSTEAQMDDMWKCLCDSR